MKTLITSTLNRLHRQRRAFLTFYLFFTGLALAALTPTVSWALSLLRPVTGRAAISTGGIVEFLVSPGGIAWVLITLTLTVLVILLQQAGMTLISASPPCRHYRTAVNALWGTGRKFLALAQLTLIQVIIHLLVAMPFLVTMGLAWAWLLADFDAYLLRVEKPPELWWFAVCATLASLGILLCNGALCLRWILSVPCLMLEHRRPLEALRQSTRLTRGHKGHATGVLISGLLAVLLLPVLVTLMFDHIAVAMFAILPEQASILVPFVLLLIAGYLLVGFAVTFVGTAAYGAFIVSLYHRARGHTASAPEPSLRRPVPDHAGAKAWGAELVVIILALGQAWLVIGSLGQQEQVTITAHRGGAFNTPENTLSAIEQAIEDGADYIEIDVQITADGVPVLWHDSDMSRIFGLEKRISEARFDDIRELDAGTWFGPQFSDERIATLAQAIETIQGRAGLFVDLKLDRNTPHLAAEVVKLLQQKDFVDGTIIAAADWATLQEVEQLEPGLKTALAALLQERTTLSDVELLATKLRNWLR